MYLLHDNLFSNNKIILVSIPRSEANIINLTNILKIVQKKYREMIFNYNIHALNLW